MIKIRYEKIFIEKTEEELNFTVEEFLKEYFLENRNIILKKLSCGGSSKILKKYDLKNERGIPDFCYEDRQGLKFIEVKSEIDGLRMSQLEWLNKYSEKFYVKIITLIIKLKLEEKNNVEELKRFVREIEDAKKYKLNREK